MDSYCQMDSQRLQKKPAFLKGGNVALPPKKLAEMNDNALLMLLVV